MKNNKKTYDLKFYGIDIDCPELYVEDIRLPEILEIFENFATSVFCKEKSDGGHCVIELIFREEPNIDVIEDLIKILEDDFQFKNIKYDKKIIDDRDWLLHVYKNFPPIIIGDFYVYGSHHDEETPNGLIGLQIDAATAFGSGEHGTTNGCLQALQSLKKEHEFKNILDMGCGSGILAIASSKLWSDAEITAVDIDEEAIYVTKNHIEYNDCRDNIKTQAGDGYNTDIVISSKPYDLIIANILAIPLKMMAEDLSLNLKDGGICVLAGLLSRQEKEIIEKHEQYGLKLLSSFNVDNWQILTMQKK